PFAEAEERMVLEVSGVSQALGPGDVRRRGDQDVPVSCQPSKDETALDLAADAQRDIHLIVHEVEVAVRDENLGRRLRMTLKKTVDQRDEQDVGQARWCRQPKRSRDLRLTLLQSCPCAVQSV